MNAAEPTAIETARAYLNASAYAGETLFAYTEQQQPGVVFLVTAEEIADLGSRLQRGERDAYSLWCADTTASSCSAGDVVDALPELYDTGLDVDALREEAGAAGDYLTCAACTHLEREIRALLAVVDLDDDGEVEAERLGPNHIICVGKTVTTVGALEQELRRSILFSDYAVECLRAWDGVETLTLTIGGEYDIEVVTA